MNHIKSFWSATVNNHRKRPPLEKKHKTDVMIIGGGFTGLATAYFLSDLGVQTVVLEKNRIGWGASGRNAGMLTTGYKKSTITLAKKEGINKAKELLDMSVDCISLVDKIVNKHKIDCSINYNGSLKLAFKPSHFEKLKKEHEFMLENFNYQTEIVKPDQMETEISSPFYRYGGLVDPHSYSFHPLNYAVGLGEIVEQLGGTIYEDSEVKSIRKVGNKFIANTQKGEIESDDLVIATNGYTTNLTKKLAKSIIPLDSHIVTTEPLPNDLSEKLILKNRVAIDTKNFLYYFRLTPDNRMLFGGRVSMKTQDNKKLYTTLRKNMVGVFPQLENIKIDYGWSGTTGFTLDFMPHIGKTEDGMYFATGYCGHGAAMSTLLGKVLALNISGRIQGKTALGGLPLKTIPLHGQRAKILNLIEHYYRLVDKIS